MTSHQMSVLSEVEAAELHLGFEEGVGLELPPFAPELQEKLVALVNCKKNLPKERNK